MSYRFRDWVVRDDMQAALDRYVHQGVRLGDFLSAVVSNDFQEACRRADNDSLENLPAFAAYVYNEMPSTCHGSREIYRAWLKTHAKKREKESA